jgi:hypothetical protein
MNQSRAMSMVEATTGAVAGYVIAVATQFAVFPMFGLTVGIIPNLGIGSCSRPCRYAAFVPSEDAFSRGCVMRGRKPSPKAI